MGMIWIPIITLSILVSLHNEMIEKEKLIYGTCEIEVNNE